MKRLCKILGLITTVTLLTAGVAAAATLGIGTGQLSAGSATVSGCTTSSLTATRDVDNSGDVTKVSVLNVPQACAGQTLAVTMKESVSPFSAGATTTVGTCSGGCTVILTGFGTVLASNVTAFALSLTQ